MTYQIKRQGTYELYRMDHDERVLVLDDEQFTLERSYFTISEGTQGELVARRKQGLDEAHRVRRGSYRIVEFEKESLFQNIPYLFLEHGDHYDEIYLTEGLPSNVGERRRYIYTDHTIAAEKLDKYLQSPPPPISHPQKEETAGDEPPVEDYFDLTAGDLAEKIRQMEPADLRRLEHYEKRHKNRSTVINTIHNQFH